MGIVVTVMNMKGGVGKTTVASHVAGLVGRYRWKTGFKRVLMIDYDPQFNLSQAVLRSKRFFDLEKAGKTCLAVLQDIDDDLDPFQIQTPSSGTPPPIRDLVSPVWRTRGGVHVDILPSTLDLMNVAIGTATGDIQLVEKRFAAFVGECRREYDLTVIDCHPAGSILSRTSLRNSDHVLIPVAPQAYAARGVALMLRFIEVHGRGKATPTPHIVFNLTPRSGPISAVEGEIRANARLGPYCLTHTLHKYKAFSEPAEGQGFVWASRKPYSSEAYANLWYFVDEFSQRINLEG